MTVSITVDRDRCIGSGLCTVHAPATFTQDSDATVVVLERSGDDLATITAAVEACPTGALGLDIEGN